MPYINKLRREQLTLEHWSELTVGDFNYLYTIEILNAWRRNPCYATIHNLKESVDSPSTISRIGELTNYLKEMNIHEKTLKVARELAFLEFYRRVGSKYEDKKCQENGDIYDREDIQIC